MEKKIKSESSSRFRGVCFNARSNKFLAKITINKKTIHLGFFNDEFVAAKAFDDAVNFYGINRRLNFPISKPENNIPNTKLIMLTHGMFAIVDDDDFEKVNKYTWFARKSGNTYYASTSTKTNGKRISFQMHQLVMGIGTGMIDHANGNGLHNYKSNLRQCTNSQNQQNTKAGKSITSKFKGVDFKKEFGKFRSRITLNHRTVSIGYFNNEIDAAIAYDKKAKELFGIWARLNFPN